MKLVAKTGADFLKYQMVVAAVWRTKITPTESSTIVPVKVDVIGWNINFVLRSYACCKTL